MNLDLVIVLKTEKSDRNELNKTIKLKLSDKNYLNKFLYYVTKFDFENIFIFYDNKSIKIEESYNTKIINFIEIKSFKINKKDEIDKIYKQISNKIKKKSIIINSNFIKNFKFNDSLFEKLNKINNLKFYKNKCLFFPKINNLLKPKNRKKFEKILEDKISNLKFISEKVSNKNEKLEKAIFLDRDGVINYDNNYVYQWSKFKFRPGVIQGLKNIMKYNYLLFIVTNQSGIGRGYFSERQFYQLHKKLKQFLCKKKIFISETQYAPYHPNAKIKKYRKKTQLRKPGNLMIKNILKVFTIDKKKSFMMGDKQSDEIAARKSNLKFFYSKGNFNTQIKEINMLIKKTK